MKTHRIRKIIVVLCFILFSTLPTFAIVERAQLGEPAPSFEITTFTNETIELSDLQGQLVILYFWASWSEQDANNQNLLSLEAFSKNNADTLTIIGINSVDSAESTQAYLREADITYANTSNSDLAYTFNIREFPSIVVISPNGVFSQVIVGNLEETMLTNLLTEFVNVVIEPDPNDEAPIPSYTLTRYQGINQSTTREGFPVLGNRDAKVVIESFSAFICSHCVTFHNDVFASLIERISLGDDIAFIYVPMHNAGELPNGIDANKAALCAGEQNLFWEYHDMLYDWHPRFQRTAFDLDRLELGANKLNLDMQEWNNCIDSNRQNDVLTAAELLFSYYDLAGVTSVLVNGEFISSDLESVNDAIDRILGSRT